MHRGVVEGVAQDRPHELRLRVGAFAQQLQSLGRCLLQDAVHQGIGLLAGRDVLTLGRVQAQDVLAHLLVEAGAALLAERALVDQRGQHRRRGVGGIERVVLEVVLQRADDVRHRVQAHHVGGAEGAAAGAAHLLAGEVVDHVVGQAVGLGLLDGGQHAGDAHAVGDEVGRVLGAHHALAQRRGDKTLELVQHRRPGGRRGDQLDQLHVARRVEEVDAAKTRAQFFRQHLRQRRDRQPRGVAGQQRVRRHVRRDACVQVALPVHALGDGLDHQVAVGQQRQMLVVVGRCYQRGQLGHAQRRRLELLQAVDGLERDAALRAFLGRQVEQHHRHLRVDQVGGDLRAHHAGAEHGHLAHVESVHQSLSLGCLARRHSTRIQVWVRPNIGAPTKPRTSSLAPLSIGVMRTR
jgi:hypothetical protein